jgi:hypothetical protein
MWVSGSSVGTFCKVPPNAIRSHPGCKGGIRKGRKFMVAIDNIPLLEGMQY